MPKMKSPKTKSLLMLPLLFTAAACGTANEERQAMKEGATTESVARDAITITESGDRAAEAPRIRPDAAPGVAFEHSYLFGLPAEKISSVQEDHADACQALGVARCRITGLDYQSEGKGDVTAMMAFKLDPALAASFTRDARAMVEKAGGDLSEASLTGTDIGTELAQQGNNETDLRDEIAAIEKQLALPALSKEVRSRLNEELLRLREELRGTKQAIGQGRAKLTLTPVVFNYETAHSIPGIDDDAPFAGAATASIKSFVTMIQFLIVAIGVLAPWALLIGGLYWLVRLIKRRKAQPAPVVDQG